MTDTDNLLAARGGTHGKWADQAQVSETLWQTILQSNRGRFSSSQAQALHMICTKLGRIAVGNHHEVDHWEDIAGYATLAAKELRRVKSNALPVEVGGIVGPLEQEALTPEQEAIIDRTFKLPSTLGPNEAGRLGTQPYTLVPDKDYRG